MGISSRVKRTRIRKLGSVDADELERALAETGKVKPSVCRPKTRHATDPLTLSDTQCSVFPAGKKLGFGSFATVFEHADDPDKVVKFTSDENDALSAAAVRGKRLKGAVRIFDVAELPNVGTLRTIYGIVAERVQEVSAESDSAIIHAFDDFLGEEAENRRVSGKRLRPGEGFDLGPDFTERAVESCAQTVRDKYRDACPVLTPKLANAVIEAGTVGGIFTTDLHAGNWGFRSDGSPVIIDFGLSRVDPKAERAVQQLAKAPKPRRVAKRRRVR